MTTALVYARLRTTDPGRWQAVAQAWRRWAALAGRLAAQFAADLVRVDTAWSGAAATAAAACLTRLRRRLVLFQVLCWQADQAAGEFAAALGQARRLLAGAVAAAGRAGLSVGDDGSVQGGSAPAVTAGLTAAIAVAERADASAAERLDRIEAAAHPPAPARPDCTTTPAGVRRWWAGLDPAVQRWLLATEPGWLAPLDGLPAADRDVANRLLLDERRTELDRALAAAGTTPGERNRLRELRHGLDALTERLAAPTGPRAYLLLLDLSEEGRVVVAVGDPDHADNVLTHVPGMTADLVSAGGELARAERVAERATELNPAASTSAVLWLDYDAPDWLSATGTGAAQAGAADLDRFQEGLRASHDDPPARHTVVGHSYGSLVVGKAAAGSGLDADNVVFVGSPGVGVDSVNQLAVPAHRVWSSTSYTDIVQYAAVAPGGLVRDLAIAAAMPVVGPLEAFGTPERELWFGRNPSDPAFGARVFASQPGGGHLGYWDRGGPALDALAAITLGRPA